MLKASSWGVGKVPPLEVMQEPINPDFIDGTV